MDDSLSPGLPLSQDKKTSPFGNISRKLIAIIAGLLVVVMVVGILVYKQYPLGINSRAASDSYTGFLIKASQNKCEKSALRCFRLVDSNGKILLFINPNIKFLKKNDLMSYLGKAVRVKGTKIDQAPDPSNLIVSTIESVNSEMFQQEMASQKILMGLGGYSPADSPFTREAGTNSKSTSIRWRNVEPTLGNLNWAGAAATELEIQLCNDLNIPCNIMIGVAPSWAVTKSTQSLLANYYPKDKTPKNADWYCPEAPINMNSSDPNDNVVKQHFIDLVKKVAERYDGDGKDDAIGANGKPLVVESFLMYNEMDYHDRNCGQAPWNTTNPEDDTKPYQDRRAGDLNKNGKPDWQDYADLQKDFYYAVKEANPAAKASIGTYGNFEVHDQLYSQNFNKDDTKVFLYKLLDYLNKTYVAKDPQFAANFPYFDVMNAHYYEVYHCNAPFQEYDEYSVGGIRGSVKWMKHILAKFNSNGKPLERPFVLSEISDPVPLLAGSYPENAMANNLWKVFVQSLSTGAEQVRWYDLGFGDKQYGLLDTTTKPPRKRPAFSAYQTLFSNLKDYKFHSIDLSNYDNLEGYIFVPADGAGGSSKKTKLSQNSANFKSQSSYIVNNLKEILWSVPTKPNFCPVKWPEWSTVREPVPLPPTIRKEFVASSIHVEDPFGKTLDITDGQTGDLDARRNGRITIEISNTPLMVTSKN